MPSHKPSSYLFIFHAQCSPDRYPVFVIDNITYIKKYASLAASKKRFLPLKISRSPFSGNSGKSLRHAPESATIFSHSARLISFLFFLLIILSISVLSHILLVLISVRISAESRLSTGAT